MPKTKTSLLLTLVSLAWTATTLAAGTFTILRLTNETGCSRGASISGGGKIVAFDSNADLVTNGNTDGNFEIFLRDQKKGITQITTSTVQDNDSAAINKAGTRIAFRSAADLVPGGNADHNGEIFLFDKKKGITQITTSTGGSNSDPKVNAAGSLIAFLSDRDLVAGGNADATAEVFLFDVKKGLKQITASAMNSEAPALNNSGAKIAFGSAADLVPGSNLDGSLELFLFDKKKGFRQITSGTACSTHSPAINASGSRIAFLSNCDVVPGSNAGAFEQVFLFDVKKGFTQITAAASLSEDVQSPAIDASGKRVAFVSNADFVSPGNADVNYEIFLFIEKKGLLQLTHTTGGQSGVSSGPSLSSSGKRIAYELTSEQTPGDNSDAQGEIYVVEQK